jgi:hypothetical protein
MPSPVLAKKKFKPKPKKGRDIKPKENTLSEVCTTSPLLYL